MCERRSRKPKVSEVHAVDEDSSRRRVEEPGDELHDGALARSAGTDQSHHFARSYVQVDRLQNFDIPIRVAEADFLEGDPPFDTFQGRPGKLDPRCRYVRRATRKCAVTLRVPSAVARKGP